MEGNFSESSCAVSAANAAASAAEGIVGIMLSRYSLPLPSAFLGVLSISFGGASAESATPLSVEENESKTVPASKEFLSVWRDIGGARCWRGCPGATDSFHLGNRSRLSKSRTESGVTKANTGPVPYCLAGVESSGLNMSTSKTLRKTYCGNHLAKRKSPLLRESLWSKPAAIEAGFPSRFASFALYPTFWVHMVCSFADIACTVQKDHRDRLRTLN